MYRPRFLLSLLLFATALPAWADETPETVALYQQHCTSCHQSEVYTRSDRKVTSLEGLHRQVQRCELALGLKWFDDEIADMADHLDAQYYRFAP